MADRVTTEVGKLQGDIALRRAEVAKLQALVEPDPATRAKLWQSVRDNVAMAKEVLSS